MNLAQTIQALLTIVKTDAQKTALPALLAFFQSAAANPSALNIAAALAKLNVDLLAALPGIEQDILKQIATLLENEIATLGK